MVFKRGSSSSRDWATIDRGSEAVGVLGIGLFGIVSSLPFLLAAPLTGGVALGELASILGGCALTVLKVADYIARTNPSDRGDRERPVERVQQRVPMGAAV